MKLQKQCYLHANEMWHVIFACLVWVMNYTQVSSYGGQAKTICHNTNLTFPEDVMLPLKKEDIFGSLLIACSVARRRFLF